MVVAGAVVLLVAVAVANDSDNGFPKHPKPTKPATTETLKLGIGFLKACPSGTRVYPLHLQTLTSATLDHAATRQMEEVASPFALHQTMAGILKHSSVQAPQAHAHFSQGSGIQGKSGTTVRRPAQGSAAKQQLGLCLCYSGPAHKPQLGWRRCKEVWRHLRGRQRREARHAHHINTNRQTQLA